MTRVKICGLTRVDEAVACVDAGADAIGLNFWPRSKRCIEDSVAQEIVQAVAGRTRLVAVVVDASSERLLRIRQFGVQWIQLHGVETPEELRHWLPEAFKAIHLDRPEPIHRWPGDELLVDAKVGELRGGTGVTCDWNAAAALARTRRLWLAGGLTPDNVVEAIRAVGPYGVDVASGVEVSPGRKDPALVQRFIANARSAR